jgi:hypothetical protein
VFEKANADFRMHRNKSGWTAYWRNHLNGYPKETLEPNNIQAASVTASTAPLAICLAALKAIN